MRQARREIMFGKRDAKKLPVTISMMMIAGIIKKRTAAQTMAVRDVGCRPKYSRMTGSNL